MRGPDRQGALIERLGVAVSTLSMVSPRQSVEKGGRGGMVRAELFLAKIERPTPERDGLFILAGLIEGLSPAIGFEESARLGVQTDRPQP